MPARTLTRDCQYSDGDSRSSSSSRVMEALRFPEQRRPLPGPGMPVRCQCGLRMMSPTFGDHELGCRVRLGSPEVPQ